MNRFHKKELNSHLNFSTIISKTIFKIQIKKTDFLNLFVAILKKRNKKFDSKIKDLFLTFRMMIVLI